MSLARTLFGHARGHKFPVVFSYYESRPYEVQIRFAPPGAFAEMYDIGRELLTVGLDRPVGCGIKVRPELGFTSVEIRFNELSVIAVDRASLAEFVSDTWKVVPRGRESEFIDEAAVEAELRRLVA